MSLSCKTKVSDLDGVGGRGGRRGDEVGVSTECRVVRGRGGHQNVLRLDIAVEEVVGMNVVKATQDLVEDALDMLSVQTLVVSCLHQLVEVAIHVLHADMQFSGKRVEEDVEGRDQVGVGRQGSKKDDFSQFQARA